jgi:hypothetical protein
MRPLLLCLSWFEKPLYAYDTPTVVHSSRRTVCSFLISRLSAFA